MINTKVIDIKFTFSRFYFWKLQLELFLCMYIQRMIKINLDDALCGKWKKESNWNNNWNWNCFQIMIICCFSACCCCRRRRCCCCCCCGGGGCGCFADFISFWYCKRHMIRSWKLQISNLFPLASLDLVSWAIQLEDFSSKIPVFTYSTHGISPLTGLHQSQKFQSSGQFWTWKSRERRLFISKI